MPITAQAKIYPLYTGTDGVRRSYTTGRPTVEAVAMGGGAVALSWTANPAAGRSIINYEIRRAVSGTESWTSVPLAAASYQSELPDPDETAYNKLVDPAGSPNGSTIFTTIASAIATANPGDVIAVKAGTYNETIRITRAGTAEQRIILRAFDPLNPPVLDSNFTKPAGWIASGNIPGSASIISLSASYWTLDGICVADSDNLGIHVGPSNNNGFFVQSWEIDTFVVGCRLYRCNVNKSMSNAYMLMNVDDCIVGGADISETCYNWWDAEPQADPGWGSAVSCAGKRIQIIENTIRQGMGEGIHAGHHISWRGGATPEAHIQAEDLTVRGNIIYDHWSANLYVTNVDRGTFERNLIFNSGDARFWKNSQTTQDYPASGIDLGSESGTYGNPTPPNGLIGSRQLKFYNNIVFGHLFNLDLSAWNGQSYDDIDFSHNTFLTTQEGTWTAGMSTIINFHGDATGDQPIGNVKWRNNVVLVGTSAELCDQWNAMLGTTTKHTNLWSHTPPSALNGTGDVIDGTGTALQNYAGTPDGSIYPGTWTQDTEDFKPVEGSPAVNMATPVSTVTVDYYGYARPTGSGYVDAGAISLSKPTTGSQTETGVAPANYVYQIRFLQDDSTYSEWSNLDAVTVT